MQLAAHLCLNTTFSHGNVPHAQGTVGEYSVLLPGAEALETNVELDGVRLHAVSYTHLTLPTKA